MSACGRGCVKTLGDRKARLIHGEFDERTLDTFGFSTSKSEASHLHELALEFSHSLGRSATEHNRPKPDFRNLSFSFGSTVRLLAPEPLQEKQLESVQTYLISLGSFITVVRKLSIYLLVEVLGKVVDNFRRFGAFTKLSLLLKVKRRDQVDELILYGDRKSVV